MKKKLVVEKEKFDAVLGALLKSGPIPRTEIKTAGKYGRKMPILRKKK